MIYWTNWTINEPIKSNLCVILCNDKHICSEINSSDNCFRLKCLFHFESIIRHWPVHVKHSFSPTACYNHGSDLHMKRSGTCSFGEGFEVCRLSDRNTDEDNWEVRDEVDVFPLCVFIGRRLCLWFFDGGKLSLLDLELNGSYVFWKQKSGQDILS